MATLLEDIKTQSDWIVQAFAADNFKLDYSVESFKSIDDFFDQHANNGKAKPNGRLSKNLGPILFSIGSYVGETIIKNVPGSVWITDDKDPLGEVNVSMKLPDGTTIWPMQRVINRFRNGSEDGIYAYGSVVAKEISQGDYWEKIKETSSRAASAKQKGNNKPWWKFW